MRKWGFWRSAHLVTELEETNQNDVARKGNFLWLAGWLLLLFWRFVFLKQTSKIKEKWLRSFSCRFFFYKNRNGTNAHRKRKSKYSERTQVGRKFQFLFFSHPRKPFHFLSVSWQISIMKSLKDWITTFFFLLWAVFTLIRTHNFFFFRSSRLFFLNLLSKLTLFQNVYYIFHNIFNRITTKN